MVATVMTAHSLETSSHFLLAADSSILTDVTIARRSLVVDINTRCSLLITIARRSTQWPIFSDRNDPREKRRTRVLPPPVSLNFAAAQFGNSPTTCSRATRKGRYFWPAINEP
ncbi:hypothetical protein WN48_01823 [Eufriesea mexicana]|nr:hypothetical protein WN48_01823 [Eufriesea mexicana]